jgi:hypothetical protein
MIWNIHDKTKAMYHKIEVTCKDVETRIQKARGAFTRLRKIWLALYINKDTKSKIGSTIWVPNLAGHM